MGIRGNLKRCVADLFPGCLSQVPLGYFSGKRVAIDFSNLYAKYKYVFRDDWRRYLDRFADSLVANGLQIIFVMDGKMPCAKIPEQARRKERMEKDTQKLSQLRELKARLSAETSEEDNRAATRLLSIYARQVNADIYRHLVDRICSGEEKLDKSDMVAQLDQVLQHLEGAQVPKLDRAEIDAYRATSHHACLLAEGEAEQTMAVMVKEGLVDYAYSEDSDLIALQCPRVIRKVSGGSTMYELFEFEKLAELSKMSPQEITEWCILCGTDYNRSPVGVAAKTALKLIKQFKNLEQVLMSKIDIWGILLAECQNTRKIFSCDDFTQDKIEKIRHSCELLLPRQQL